MTTRPGDEVRGFGHAWPPREAVTGWLVSQCDALGADMAVVALLSAGQMLVPRWWLGYPDEVVESWGRIALHLATPLVDALHGGPVIVSSVRELTHRYPLMGVRPTTGCPALAAVAIPGPAGAAVGVLGVSFSSSLPPSLTPGALVRAAHTLGANLHDRDRWTGAPDPPAAAEPQESPARPEGLSPGPVPGLEALDDPRRRAELTRLGLGSGEGVVTGSVHRLTALAARLLGADRAQISLLGTEQWLASTVGFTPVQDARRSALRESLCSVTVASGGPVVIADAQGHPWVRDLPPVRVDGVRRYAGVPLVSADGLAIGALCVFDGRADPWPDDADATLTELAAAAMAEMALRVANRELVATAERQRRLQAVTAALSSAATVHAVAEVILHGGIELIARDGVVGVLSPGGTHMRTWPTRGIPAELVQDMLLLPVDAATPITRAVATGEPVAVASLAEIGALFPDAVPTHQATGTRSVLAVPARAGGVTLGALAFGFDTEDAVDDDVLTYARTLGDLTGQALDRARLYEREYHAAHQLQRALMPAATPELPGVQAAVCYRPADSDHEIGGDWYDVFPLPAGRVGIAIGDVVGHDLHAAAAMGQLHAVLRAVAATSSGPADALQRLHEAASGIPGASYTTVGYAEYDPASGTLRHACAGHLPPLLAVGGHAGYLPGGLSTPLGVSHEARHPSRAEATITVSPGSLLLWCTDGLVERRGEDIDTGLDRLAHLVAALVDDDPARCCDAVMAEMVGGALLRDDIALLCLRLGRVDGG